MITTKSDKEIAILKEGGGKLASILKKAARMIKVGMRTDELDKEVERMIREAGAEPAFKGYIPSGAQHAYPAATCISVNEVIVHGVPSEYMFRDGDLVTIDAGLLYGGLYTDSAITVALGKIDKEKKRLMAVTKKALVIGIDMARVGKTTGDIGHVIGNYVEKKGLQVIRNLTGHGVGYAVHEDPIIFNYGQPGTGVLLKEGMVVAVEPMVSMSSQHAMQMDDDSFVTHDGSLSAHFEHTIAIAKKGPIIITE